MYRPIVVNVYLGVAVVKRWSAKHYADSIQAPSQIDHIDETPEFERDTRILAPSPWCACPVCVRALILLRL